ncbi:P-loop containing nucleoside triphosphate hydrolase protein [Flammula alnicola]|nr:P-loop containing nucleoside triphosphate hydrolase protein [Flammula alnicola]
MESDKLPHETPEILPLSATFTPQTLTIASLIVALLLLAALFFLGTKRSKSRGNTFLLVGPSDAGKTSILSQLVYGQTLPTQTSMQANTSALILSSKKTIKVTDIPGHARLRNQFLEYLPETKAIGFVVDANTVSRNAPAVAEHLHLVLHALTSLPPSQAQPSLLILAHKSDLFKATSASNTSPNTLAVNRVKTILERELEKRRVSQSGGINIEQLGEEGERSDMGGLECGEKEGSTFKFDDWEGGEISFLGTSTLSTSSQTEKGASEGGLDNLWEWLEENM